MEISIFIAKILGLYYLTAAFGIILNKSFYHRVMENFYTNPALFLLSGFIAFISGILIILSHNIWELNWTVLVTIFGWAAFIKGICLIIFPNRFRDFFKIYEKNERLLIIHSLLTFLFGILFAFFGFFTKIQQ